MKEYKINLGYRGRYFDWRCCAKSYRDAATKLDCGEYHLKTYGYCNKTNNPYDGVFLKPYGHNTRHLFDYNKEYELVYVKEVVDKEAREWMQQIKTSE